MAQHAPRAPLCLLVPWLRIASLLLRLAVPAAAAPVPAGDSIDPAKLAMHTRQRLSDWCGSASFFVWLFAQTPQIYTNYHRKSVDGLSGVFVAQWMLGDVLNLVGSLLTHQLPFQIAVAIYFCSIDLCILVQFIYYTMIYSHRSAASPPSQQSVGRYSRRRRQRLSEPGYGATSKSRTGPGRTIPGPVDPAQDQVESPAQQEPLLEEPLSHDLEGALPDEASSLLSRPRAGLRTLRWMMGRKRDAGSGDSSDEEHGEDEEPGRGRGMTRTAAIVASRHDRHAGQSATRLASEGSRSQPLSPSPAPCAADSQMDQNQTLPSDHTVIAKPKSASALPAAWRSRTTSGRDTRARSRRRQASRPSGPSTIVLLAAGILFTTQAFPRAPSDASQPATLLGMTLPADAARPMWLLSSPSLDTSDETLERVVGRISAWFCTLLYTTSRLPQIYVNLTRRSVKGLSIMLFLSAFMGNSLYSASVLLNPQASGSGSRAYLLESLPFLLGSGGTLIFDIIIVAQWIAWRGNEPRPIAYVQKPSRPWTSRRDSSTAPLTRGGSTSRPALSPEREHRYARHRSRSIRRSLSRRSTSLHRSSSRPP